MSKKPNNLPLLHDNTTLSYNLLGEVQTQTQDEIEVTQKRAPHSYNTTLSFLDQRITSTIDTQAKETRLTYEKQEIVLSYSIEDKTQTTTYPNGTQEHYVFNEAGELVSLHTAKRDYRYERDPLGRITKLNDKLYEYDAIGRLTRAGSTLFEYDKAGNNRQQESIYDTSMNQRLEDAHYTYSYDANGNLASKRDKETNNLYLYKYNSFNQLILHTKADSTEQYLYEMTFSYDGFNRRISKTYQDHTDNTKSYAHHYVYDNENIIAILDLHQNKQHLATILHHPTRTDTPLSITNHTTNKTYYYHRDHQGSIVALTNSEGKEVENITYDGHYGKILKHTKEEETVNPYGYTGRETDQEDLYYYRARYYDPTTQRFLSRDPIEFEAGDFNFYRYVGGDPVNFRDPSGLIKGAGGSGSVTDGISGVTGRLKDAKDNESDFEKCLAKAKAKCPDKDGSSECDIPRYKEEDLCRRSLYGKTLLKPLSIIPDKYLTPQPKTPDTNTTTPISSDGNMTQGRESTSELSWIVVKDENGTIIDSVFSGGCD